MGNKKKRSHTAQAAATHSTSANHIHSADVQYGDIDKLDWSDNFPEPPLDSKQYSEAIRAHLNEFDDIAAKQANGHAMERTSTDSALSSSMSRLRMQPPSGSSSKSKKKNNKSAEDSKDRIWNTTTNEERERIKEFWLNLGEEERKSLIKVEKEAVLKKMKEQQKHSCSCSVCGRKRTAIEEELEVLYDAYYEELEQYANQQQFPSQSSLTSSRPNHRPRHNKITEVLGSEDSEGSYEDDEDLESDLLTDEDELSEDDYSDDDYEERAPTEFFKFGNSLTVKGGILTVADDLLRNDGKKFIEMMEQLAERRMQREEEAAMEAREYDDEEDDDFDDDDIDSEDYDDDDDDQDVLTEEQRMAEGRRMFQIFAARMFEQRVLTAYREKVAQERQARLLQELELEDSREKERELKKQKEKEKKKDKKRQQQQKKEEERLKKEAEKAAEEAALKAEEERKAEELRKRKEEQRLKKEAEKRLADAEKQRKEEEKRKRMSEERAREQKRLEQVAKEKKAKEEAARKEREAKEQAAKEAREAKDVKVKKDTPRAKESEPSPRQVAPTTILTRKVSPPTKSSSLQSSPAVPRGPTNTSSRPEPVMITSNGHGPSFQGPPRNGPSNSSATPAFQTSQNSFPRAALGHPPSMPVPLPPPGIGSHSSTLHDPYGFGNAQQKHFPPSNVMTRPNGSIAPALHGPPGVFATTQSMHVPAHIRSQVSPPSRSSQPHAPQHNTAPFNAFPGVIRNGNPQREELLGEDIFARRSVPQSETPPVSISAIGTIGRPAAPRINSQQLPAPIQRPMNGAAQRSRFGFDSKNDIVGSRALLDDDDPVIPAPAPLIHSNDTWSSSPKPTWQNSNPSLEEMKDRWGSIGPKKVDAFTNVNTPSSTTWGF